MKILSQMHDHRICKFIENGILAEAQNRSKMKSMLIDEII